MLDNFGSVTGIIALISVISFGTGILLDWLMNRQPLPDLPKEINYES